MQKIDDEANFENKQFFFTGKIPFLAKSDTWIQ